MRSFLASALATAALALLVAGCGGGDEPAASTAATDGAPLASPVEEVLALQFEFLREQGAAIPPLRRIAACEGPDAHACVTKGARDFAALTDQAVTRISRVRDGIGNACAREHADRYIDALGDLGEVLRQLAQDGDRAQARQGLLDAQERLGATGASIEDCVKAG
jgi:hypothetical protein